MTVKYTLRDYQREAVDKVIEYVKRSVEPCLLELATGAGKSLICAEIARIIFGMTGKRVLCIAPSAELVKQNHAKYLLTGNPASMYSASAGAKSLRHPVVFGTPLTIKGRISAFQRDFAMVIVDEGDLLTPTVKAIIEAMREGNPNLRVVLLTATPYRLGTGYIFREWPDGRVNGEDVAIEPYAGKLLYRVEPRYLIEQRFLTPPVIGGTDPDVAYDTSALLPNKQGKFDAVAVDRAYHGHGRLTAAICGAIVAKARNRKGVLIYAATVQHAQEVMASLPPELSAIVTGETGDREAILKRFAAQRLKYVVNVGVLTVGVDLPHVDVIAVLRKTESARLLQQIIGRGLRPVYAPGMPLDTISQREAAMIAGGKPDCLYLDFTADNMSTHFPDGDVFAPTIRAKGKAEGGGGLTCICPDCGYENSFSAKVDCLDYAKDEAGYCVDVFGEQIMTDYGPMPGHHGRRCFGMVQVGKNEWDRCGYRYTGKDCPSCGEKNDIAARYCFVKDCRAEIVDPHKALELQFKQFKKDVNQLQTDRVISAEYKPGVSRAGNKTIRADWKTEFRHFSTWFTVDAKHPQAVRDYNAFNNATNGASEMPETISYRKDGEFMRVYGYNEPPDEMEDSA